MKKIMLFLLIVVIPASLFAGTLLEQSLKGYDPYLADRDGFDSLFMNPAGISNQTQYFSLSAEGGTWGKLENYELLKDNVDAIASMVEGGGQFTAEEAGSLLPLLTGELDQSTLNTLLTGTSVFGMTPEQAADYDWSSLGGADLTALETNMSDPALQQAIMEQFDEVNYSVESELRLGTLIKGIGFGVYNNTYMLYSLGAQGIEDMVTETGAVAGYGFDMGPFSRGFSGKFALLLADDPLYPFSIVEGEIDQQQILYGYAWGLDAGMIWEPFDSLSLAVLFSDVIGSVTPVEDMGSGTIEEFMNGDIEGPSGGYAWNLDLSAGLSWQPDWRGIRPKFSLDFYDIIAMARTLSDGDYSGVEDFYQTEAATFLRHMRVGANVRLMNWLDIGASYYLEYITLGVGVDIKYLEFFIEAKTKQNFSDVGANALLKFKI